jgi:hypothetical protein
MLFAESNRGIFKWSEAMKSEDIKRLMMGQIKMKELNALKDICDNIIENEEKTGNYLFFVFVSTPLVK